MEGNPKIATHRDGRFYGVIIITSNLNPLKVAYRGVNRTASQYSLILVYGGIYSTLRYGQTVSIQAVTKWRGHASWFFL